MDFRDGIAVITGGGGMLGRALGAALGTRGARAISLTRAECDISRAEDRRRIFEGRPSVVFNCAAHTKVDLCEQEMARADEINGYAVGELAALCGEYGAGLVHVSTDFVFDGRGDRPDRVDDAVHPLSAYGRSKLLGERELQKRAPRDWLIVRTAWVYGRGGANFPRTMVQAARAGKPLRVVRDQVGSPTYAGDLAEAILILVEKGARGIWHVTNSGETNWHEFARATLAEFGLKNEVAAITAAEWEKIRPGSAVRPGYSVLDIAPFEKLAGRTMRPWREALGDFRRAVESAGEF
jgi:dTDP-4-dehydrorhamnose reductase